MHWQMNILIKGKVGNSFLKFFIIFLVLFIFWTNYALAQWVHGDVNDPFDDTSTIMAMTQTEDGFALAVGCKNDSLFVSAKPMFFYSSSFKVPVKFRFDKEKPVNTSWIGLKEIAAIRGEDAESFANAVIKYRTLVIKIADSETTTVNLKGASAHLRKVLSACKHTINK